MVAGPSAGRTEPVVSSAPAWSILAILETETCAAGAPGAIDELRRELERYTLRVEIASVASRTDQGPGG
jgi:hypothetical protein